MFLPLARQPCPDLGFPAPPTGPAVTPLASHCHYSCPWPSSGGRAVGSLPSPPVGPGLVSSPEGLCSDVLSPFKIFLLSEILET